MGDNRNTKGLGKLQRRDMLKAMTAVPAALIPLGSVAAAEAKTPKPTAETQAAGGYRLKALNDQEYQTIKVLSEWIIPADNRSGSAAQAGVPEFIDDWLDFQKGDLLAQIRGGLLWLDMECKHQHGQAFIHCSEADQKNILDRIAYPDKASPADSNYVAFFTQLRELVVGGFYTSEMGVKDLPYLGNKVVEHWEGCPENVLDKIEANLKALKVGLSLRGTEQS